MLIPHAISMANVRKAGLDAAHVEIEPDRVAQEAQVTNSTGHIKRHLGSNSD
jgi:hypothetical protein